MPEAVSESTISTVPMTWWVVGIGLALLLPFAIGIWMGLRQRIVAYRNHFDVMLVVGLYLIPAAIAGLAFTLGGGGSSDANDGGNELLWAFAALAVVLDALLFVLTRTWIDNPNPLKMLLALYVKVPLAVFFFMHFGNIFSGKQPGSRRKSVFWTLLLVPLIHGLVKDKRGKLPGLTQRPR